MHWVELHSAPVLHDAPRSLTGKHSPAAQYWPFPPLQSELFTQTAPAQTSPSHPFGQTSSE
jgi:hypothetical protein